MSPVRRLDLLERQLEASETRFNALVQAVKQAIEELEKRTYHPQVTSAMLAHRLTELGVKDVPQTGPKA